MSKISLFDVAPGVLDALHDASDLLGPVLSVETRGLAVRGRRAVGVVQKRLDGNEDPRHVVCDPYPREEATVGREMDNRSPILIECV
jgi:hypothetical protein